MKTELATKVGNKAGQRLLEQLSTKSRVRDLQHVFELVGFAGNTKEPMLLDFLETSFDSRTVASQLLLTVRQNTDNLVWPVAAQSAE